MTRRLLASLCLCALPLLPPSMAHATILTFDIRDPGQYPFSEDFPEGVPQGQFAGYGNHVSGPTALNGSLQFGYGVGAEGYTPNVTVQYGPFSIFTGGPQLWRYDFGDLDRVMYQGSTGAVGNDYDHLDIILTAAPGYDVVLYGFDLGGWFRTDYTIASVIVFDGQPFPFLTPTNQIEILTDVLVQGSQGHTSISFATPPRGHELWLRIDAGNLGDLSENIGIDNIRFGEAPTAQTVPEPAGLALVGAALAALSWRRRTSSC